MIIKLEKIKIDSQGLISGLPQEFDLDNSFIKTIVAATNCTNGQCCDCE